MRRLSLSIVGLCVAAGVAALWGALSSGQAMADDAPAAAVAPKALALHNAKDPVSGQDASAATTLVWEGLEIQFACDDNLAKFQADPAGYAVELLRDLAAQRDALHATLAKVQAALEPAGAAAGEAQDCGCEGWPPRSEGKCSAGACGSDKCAEGVCGDKGCPCRDAKGEQTAADTKPSVAPQPAGGPKPAGDAVPVPPAAPAMPATMPPAVPPAVGVPATALALVDLVNAHCPVMPEHEARAEATVTYRNVKVRLCCPGCTKKFLANPEALLQQLAADPAVAARLRDARAAWDGAHPSNASASSPAK